MKCTSEVLRRSPAMRCTLKVLRSPSALEYIDGIRFYSSSGSLHFSIAELTELLQQELGSLDSERQHFSGRRKAWYELRQHAALVLGAVDSSNGPVAGGGSRALGSSHLQKDVVESESPDAVGTDTPTCMQVANSGAIGIVENKTPEEPSLMMVEVAATLADNAAGNVTSYQALLSMMQDDSTGVLLSRDEASTGMNTENVSTKLECRTENMLSSHLSKPYVDVKSFNQETSKTMDTNKTGSSIDAANDSFGTTSRVETQCMVSCEGSPELGTPEDGAFTYIDVSLTENAGRILDSRMQDVNLLHLSDGQVGSYSLDHGTNVAPSVLPNEKVVCGSMPLSIMHENGIVEIVAQVTTKSSFQEKSYSNNSVELDSQQSMPLSTINKDTIEFATPWVHDQRLGGLSHSSVCANEDGDPNILFHVESFVAKDGEKTECDGHLITADYSGGGDGIDAGEHSLQSVSLPIVYGDTTSRANLLGDSSQHSVVEDGNGDAAMLVEGDSTLCAANCSVEGDENVAGLSAEKTSRGHATTAEKVFRKHPHDEVVRLLLARAKADNWVQLLEDIKFQDILVTPAEVARVLRMLKSAAKAWDFFRWVTSLPGYAHDVPCYAIMLELLGRASEFSRMEDVLDEMHQMHVGHTINTLNILIGTYVTAERIHKAEGWFAKVQQLGLKPTSYTYSCLLQGYSKSGNLSKALEKYEAMSEEGLPLDSISYNMLLDSLSKNGQVDAVLKIFDNLKQIGNIANIYTYTIVVRTLANAGRFDEAFELFEDMSASGIHPNKFTYNALFGALMQTKNLEDSMKLFEKMLKNGVEPDFSTYQHIVKLLCKRKQFHKVTEVIDAIEEEPVKEEAYESFIKVLGRMGYLQEACMLLERLKSEGLRPSKMLLTSLIGNLCRAGDPDQALVVMGEMDRRGYKSDSTMCNTMISALRNKNKFKAAYALFKRMKEKGPAPDSVTYNILVSGAIKTGKLALAEALFNEMEKSRCMPNIITYNSLMQSFARAGNVNTMIRLLAAMESKGITPDVVTYNLMIDCYGRVDKPDKALELLDEMKRKGCSPSHVTYNIILQLLASAGRMDSVVLYFEQMKEEGFVPDVMTFSILSRVYDNCPHLNKSHLMAEIKKAGLSYNIPTS